MRVQSVLQIAGGEFNVLVLTRLGHVETWGVCLV